jgi:uncharacterized protein YigE (DUF2233 family)
MGTRGYWRGLLVGLLALALFMACSDAATQDAHVILHTPDHSYSAAHKTPLLSSPTLSLSTTPPKTGTLVASPTVVASPTSSRTPPIWANLAPGVSERYIPVNMPDPEEPFYIYALRLDPTRVVFQVHYDREQPRSIEEWQAATGAAVVLNGGFFSGNNTPVGRIVVDGWLYGYPLDYGDDSVGVPGLFAILDNEVSIYGLGRSSFSPRGLRFDYAVESYPLLLLPGGQPTFPVDTGKLARRTVIGVDEWGYVIILLSDTPSLSLHELADWLAGSDLYLDSALNLDGGRSSGLMVSLRGEVRYFPAYVPLPIVIGIYTRGSQ